MGGWLGFHESGNWPIIFCLHKGTSNPPAGSTSNTVGGVKAAADRGGAGVLCSMLDVLLCHRLVGIAHCALLLCSFHTGVPVDTDTLLQRATFGSG